jgi:hypothetical protein
MLDYHNYPRISGSLRAHSNIAERLHYRGNIDELQRRRRRQQQQQQDIQKQSSDDQALKVYTWLELQQLCLKYCSSSITIENDFKKLRKYAIEYLGSENDSSSIDSLCVYLFDFFRTIQQIQVSHLKELKLRFPLYSQRLVSQTLELVQSIVASMSPDFADEYVRNNHQTKKASFFGANIEFRSLSLSIIADVKPWLERLSHDMAIREQEKINREETPNEILPSINATATAAASSTIYTKTWLENHLRVVLRTRADKGDLSQQEFCNLVFENLVSSESDDEIQHVLCDIIGFDHIELIVDLIQNRQSIIDGVLNSAKARPREIVRAPEVTQRSGQPVHGPTIVIQSEQEKRLEKQWRKQDRRQQQQQQQQPVDDDLAEFSNPELLRYERERQLLVAASERYEKLSNRSQTSSTHKRVKYPFVFDHLQEVKQSTAYVGGQNLLLPENTERKSTNTFDLVHIPCAEQIKLSSLGKHICPALVRFEDFESLGQILFRDSIKTLNLVQSIVYKTAAFSNENILISAP